MTALNAAVNSFESELLKQSDIQIEQLHERLDRATLEMGWVFGLGWSLGLMGRSKNRNNYRRR